MFNFKWIVNVALLGLLVIGLSSIAGDYDDMDSEDQPLVKALRHMYFGLQIGYANADYTDSLLKPGFAPTDITKDHYAARVYIGYDFNQYIAAEVTAVYFLTRPEFKGVPGRRNEDLKIKNNIFSITGKFTWPVYDDINLYAQGGIGYIVREEIVSRQMTVLPKGEFFTPIYGLGASYNFHSDWFLDLSWLQTPRSGDKQLPQENFIGIGIYYSFPKS